MESISSIVVIRGVRRIEESLLQHVMSSCQHNSSFQLIKLTFKLASHTIIFSILIFHPVSFLYYILSFYLFLFRFISFVIILVSLDFLIRSIVRSFVQSIISSQCFLPVCIYSFILAFFILKAANAMLKDTASSSPTPVTRN